MGFQIKKLSEDHSCVALPYQIPRVAINSEERDELLRRKGRGSKGTKACNEHGLPVESTMTFSMRFPRNQAWDFGRSTKSRGSQFATYQLLIIFQQNSQPRPSRFCTTTTQHQHQHRHSNHINNHRYIHENFVICCYWNGGCLCTDPLLTMPCRTTASTCETHCNHTKRVSHGVSSERTSAPLGVASTFFFFLHRCGSGATAPLVPELRFNACCDQHDVCYASCNRTKDNCDRAFYQCMLTACQNEPDGLQMEGCRELAACYAGTVRNTMSTTTTTTTTITTITTITTVATLTKQEATTTGANT